MEIEKGYTLIEIILVVAIIALFSGLTLAYYNNFNEDRRLTAEAKQLVDVLNLAYKKANSADLTPNSACTTFAGYDVVFYTGSPSSYKLFFNCGTDQMVSQYNLANGIVISNTTAKSILFKPLSAGTDLTAPATITITNNISGKCKKMQINPAGTIEELSTCP